jgi:hypothetical protein
VAALEAAGSEAQVSSLSKADASTGSMNAICHIDKSRDGEGNGTRSGSA